MNILIVDDEQMIRNWLSLLISRINTQDITVYCVGDAFTAMEYCHKHSIDLVITDISMPQKSGLELIDDIHEAFPQINIAVLSAYDNYEYIRHALKHGAIDYILKSEMKIDDITALLNKVQMCGEMGSSASGIQISDYLRQQNDNRALATFLTNASADPYAFLKSLSVPLNANLLGAHFFALDEYPKDVEQLALLQNLLNLTIKSENIIGCAFVLGQGPYLGWLYEPRSHIAEYQQQEYAKLSLLCTQNIEKYFGYHTCYKKQEICHHAEGLRSILINFIDFLDIYHFYPDRTPPNHLSPLSSDLISHMNKLHRQLGTYDHDTYSNMTDMIRNSVQDWFSCCVSPREIKFELSHVVTLLFSYIKKEVSSADVSAKYHEFLQEIDQAITYTEIEQIMEQAFTFFQSTCQPTPLLSPSMRQAIDYINHHYSSKLTLDQVAAHIYLNKTYVSQLFRKQLNISFGEYLEQVRLENAKRLLRTTTMSITQICESVGYTSQSYFTKVFKKSLGCSPYKYRMFSAAPNATNLLDSY